MNDIKKKSAVVKYTEWVIKWKWVVLAMTLLITFGFATGMKKFGFNNNYKVFFSEENPQLKAFEALQKKYTKDDNVFIVIAPKNGQVFSKETIKAIQAIVDSSWQTPYSSRVDAITNFQHTRAVEDDMFVEDLIYDVETMTPDQLNNAKQIALAEPFIKDRLLNDEASITAVNVTCKIDEDQVTAAPEIAAFARRFTANIEQEFPGVKTYLSGTVMLSNAFGEAGQKDFTTLTPLMYLVIIITMMLITRSITGTISTVIILFMSLLTALGAVLLAGVQFTSASIMAPTMILTLAVADSIHILTVMLRNMRAGMSKNEAIVESMRINFAPVMITSLTTVVGFLTLNFSDAPPFRDLGNTAAIGVAAAFLYSISTLPALMTIFPVRVKQSEENPDGFFGRPLAILADFVSDNHKKILVIGTILIGLFAFLATRNDLNEQFVAYFKKSIQFRQDTDFMTDNLTGIYSVEYSVNSGEEGGISNPEYLQKLDAFKEYMENHEKVVHVNSYTTIAKRVNKSMHGDDINYYKLPESREEAAQYLLLYEMSLPYGLDLNNQINVDKSETRFTATLDKITAKELIQISKEGENWLEEHGIKGEGNIGISTAIMFANLTQRQIKSMLNGAVWAILLIVLALIFALRSLKLGLLSIVPNVVPIVVGYGIWYLLSGTITSALAVVFSLTIGIVVDDTVHILSKYLRARRQDGASPREAIKYSFKMVGSAIIITTIVLSAGFLILAQSSFVMNSSAAVLTMITIVLALIIDLFILPALLLIIDKE